MRDVTSGLIIGATLLVSGSLSLKAIESKMKLRYDKPADEWAKSLPLGNDHLGVIIYGGMETETLALNGSTMWPGEYDEHQQRPFGRGKLNQVRKLFFENSLSEDSHVTGNMMAGSPHSAETHPPMGDSKINFSYPQEGIPDYRHELDLRTIMNIINYKVDNTEYTRQCITPNPDDVVAIHAEASHPKAIAMELELKLLRQANVVTSGNRLIYTSNTRFEKRGKGGVHFEGRIAVRIKGGIIKAEGKKLYIEKTTGVTLLFDTRTNSKNDTFSGYNYKIKYEKTIELASGKDFKTLKKKHIEDYPPLFSRVGLSFEHHAELDHLPSDRRWARIEKEESDPGSDALFFQYAHYLLIVSSRPNSPPSVALQGFFNDNLVCHMRWTNDYHLDTNTEQNYWIANIGNLAERHLPPFDYIKGLSVHSAKTAKDLYSYKEWTTHTTANPWGYTAVSGSILWGSSPTAFSWLTSHLWMQCDYTQDRDFLKNTVYPLLKSSAESLSDYMVIDLRNNCLVTGPSISPGSNFRHQGQEFRVSMIPTCDRVLAYEIFLACLQSTEILSVDASFADSLRTAISQLPSFRIGTSGGVREWPEDYEETHPNYRHTTHLLSLYLYSQVTLDKVPELAQAATKAIEGRLATKDWEDTEWSCVNIICFYARLKDSEEAYSGVGQLPGKLSRKNMFIVSPAGIAGIGEDIFVFDENTTGVTGMAEMLLRSHDNCIGLLPCLPEEWKNGSSKGLYARGDIEIGISWENARIESMVFEATVATELTLRLPNAEAYRWRLNKKTFTPRKNADGSVQVRMNVDDCITIIPI